MNPFNRYESYAVIDTVDQLYSDDSGLFFDLKMVSPPHIIRGDVIANLLDFDIGVNEFKLQSCNYLHFGTNTLSKGMNPIIPRPGL